MMKNRLNFSHSSRLASSFLIVLGLACVSSAQLDLHKHQNKANWKLAKQFAGASLAPYLYSSSITPRWINDSNRFYYAWKDSSGWKYWLVDSSKKKKEPLFDTDKMAALITEANYTPIDSTILQIGTITFDKENENLLSFTYDNMRYQYDREKETIKKLGAPPRNNNQTPPNRFGGGQGGDFRNWSPDRKSYVFAEKHNLYYVEVSEDKKESDPVQLTKDGEEDYSFGNTNNKIRNRKEGEEYRVRGRVTWSKDSKRFFTNRFDSRKVKELFLVNSLSNPRPTLLSYKYAMPGDVDVTQMEMFAFKRENKEFKELDIARYKDQRLFDIHFQDTTSDSLRFVRRDRLQRNLEFVEMDLDSGKVKVLLTEKTEKAFLERQNARYVKPGGDFIWFSERTGWGHFYLYSNDGKLKNAITSGPWRASSISKVDEKAGVIYLNGNGRERGENPYYNHFYSVKLDGSDFKLLNAGNADHRSTMSPDNKFFIDTASRIDMPSKIVLKDAKGSEVMPLAEMDIDRLLSAGWQMPEPFVVKAADGVNDIWGNMWKPTDFNEHRKYPIIAYVYPGPQTESVSSTFTTVTQLQELAQLGFIVIQIGNRGGNPARSNAYHSFGYFNLRDYGLADKKAGIEELGRRHPFIDTDKVGIFGHSGGGFMTGAALLLPPYNEFFKVGVSSAGNHDNNVYNANWSEQHHGLKEVPVKQEGGSSAEEAVYTGRTFTPDEQIDNLQEAFLLMESDQATPQDKEDDQKGETKFEIKVPANHELAANLKGHLLLVHGDMDNNVHPAGTVRLVDALIKANKRFDFMIMPGQAHGFGSMTPYFRQMTMEYFAEHLLGDYYKGSSDMNNKGDR